MIYSEHNEDRINYIIQMLSEMDVDGYTMQYIIEQVGMEDQMLRQLVMRSDPKRLLDLTKEKVIRLIE